MRTDLKGSIQYKDIFIRNGNAQGGIAHVLCIFLFYLYILIWFFFLPFSIFFRSGLVSVFLKGRKPWDSKPIFEIPFIFPFFFLLCWHVVFGAVGGYNTLSGICLVFYSILTLKTSRVFGFPLHPLHDLWERLLFTYSFNSTTKTVRHRKHVDVSLFFKEKKNKSILLPCIGYLKNRKLFIDLCCRRIIFY